MVYVDGAEHIYKGGLLVKILGQFRETHTKEENSWK